MTQAELNREVARLTGENVATIAHRGFSLVGDEQGYEQSQQVHRSPLTVDWDDVQARNSVAVWEQPHQPVAV